MNRYASISRSLLDDLMLKYTVKEVKLLFYFQMFQFAVQIFKYKSIKIILILEIFSACGIIYN